MKKLSCILLIDDNEADNFFHKLVINESKCSKHVITLQSGKKAIEYLKSPKFVQPDLIFLDINMPGMNGWDFLEEYKDLPLNKRQETRIVMLTTSLNPDDEVKARTFPEVTGFKIKPLSSNILNEILEDQFKKMMR